MILFLTVAACFISVWAYSNYYHAITRSGFVSNRFSWLIWCLSVSLETLTYSSISGDFIKNICFIVSVIACIVITARIWLKSAWKNPDRLEKATLLFCTVALLSWGIFRSPWIAHLCLLVSIPVSFIPLYKSVFQNHQVEKLKPWLLWLISDMIVLVIVMARLQNVNELPYVVTELICHAMVPAIMFYGWLKEKGRVFEIYDRRNGAGQRLASAFLSKNEGTAYPDIQPFKVVYISREAGANRQGSLQTSSDWMTPSYAKAGDKNFVTKRTDVPIFKNGFVSVIRLGNKNPGIKLLSDYRA